MKNIFKNNFNEILVKSPKLNVHGLVSKSPKVEMYIVFMTKDQQVNDYYNLI